jgi:hypothetical protein
MENKKTADEYPETTQDLIFAYILLCIECTSYIIQGANLHHVLSNCSFDGTDE